MATKKRKSKKKKLETWQRNVITRHLTRDQIVDEIDRGARKMIGMSGEKMLRAYHTGTLEDPGFVRPLLMLSNLLPKNDPFFGPYRRTSR